MSLQLQIIHIPEGELLAETLCNLPASGGLLGRASDCTLSMPDNSRTVSSRHARLFREGSQWLVEDLSTNGLFINQSPVPLGPGKRHQLTDGDILTCGEYRIMANLFSPDSSQTGGVNTISRPESVPQGDERDPFASNTETLTTMTALDDPFADALATLHNDDNRAQPLPDFDSSVRGQQNTELPDSDHDSDFPQPDRSQLINILDPNDNPPYIHQRDRALSTGGRLS